MHLSNNWKSSTHIVILYYRPYSCGKFVSNILSFNRNFVAQIPLTSDVEKWHSSIDTLQHNFDESLLNDYKINQIFLTIPPAKERCKDWYDYELGCSMFWGFDSTDPNPDNLNAVALEILKNKKYCFIVAHDYTEWQQVKTLFPNAQTIEIVNDDRIRRLSMQLKSTQHVQQSVNKSIDGNIKFDIDLLFDQEKFFQQVKNLIKHFELEDSALDPKVYDYYQQYVDLYE